MARKREFDEIEALKKATQLFWEQGYEKTSMDDLVNHMGVHRKSIYDTFGNKHELFIKVFEYYQKTTSKQLMEYISTKESALDKINAIFEFSIINNIEQAKGCLVVNSAVELAFHDETVAEIVRNNYTETEKMIFKLLQIGQVNGEFSAQLDLSETAKFIHNALIGIRVQIKTARDLQELQPIISMTLKVLQNLKREEISYESSTN